MAATPIVRIQGALDVETHQPLLNALRPVLEVMPPGGVTLDLREVPFIDSSGLAALVRLRRAVSEHNRGALTLAGCSPAVLSALQTTRLETLFVLTP